ncbi:MAG: YbfB/YjiJ family MFS transporter, partial [Betaproteobacteria bacterium]
MNARHATLWMAAWLSLGPAVSNGFARFAYALLLPPMRDDLGWTYTQAGSMNSFNAMGYLAGSLLAFHGVAVIGARRLFMAGMWVTSIALMLSGMTADFNLLAALRFAAGLSGAVVFIAGGALAAALYPRDPSRSAAAIAIYFAGGGIGIVLPGITLPWLFALRGNQAWPSAWIGMGAVAVAISLLCALTIAPATAASAAPADTPWKFRAFAALLAGYFLFGAGYIAYMTFIIAWMRDRGSGPEAVAATWGALGLATVLAPRVWRRPIATWRGGRPAAACILVLVAGASLPLFNTSLV